MKICILNSEDSDGGAAKSTLELHNALRNLGEDSTFLVRQKRHKNNQILKIASNNKTSYLEEKIFEKIERKIIRRQRTAISNTKFSFPYPGIDLSCHKRITDCDIINLHWLSGFQSVESIAALAWTGKPIVWSLHDENPFTGGCHFSSDCKGYEEDCKACPQLHESSHMLPYLTLKNKKSLWSDSFVIVSQSQWLASKARNSSVFKNCRIEVIPGCIDTDAFIPRSKEESKKKFGIKGTTSTILLVIGSNAKRKGFEFFLDSLRFCKFDSSFEKLLADRQLTFLIVGRPPDGIKELGIPYMYFGMINDEKKIADAYSAADLFVLPSIEDNFPRTMREAISCGTPVLAFDIGGISEMVVNGYTGILTENINSEELGKNLIFALKNKPLLENMSRNCIDMTQKDFTCSQQAQRYRDLFYDVLENHGNRRKDPPPSSFVDSKYQLKQGLYSKEYLDFFFGLYQEAAIELLLQIDLESGSSMELQSFIRFFKNRIKLF